MRKSRNRNLFVEIDSRRQEENIENENLSYDEMQSLPERKTQYSQKCYQK